MLNRRGKVEVVATAEEAGANNRANEGMKRGGEGEEEEYVVVEGKEIITKCGEGRTIILNGWTEGVDKLF
jgi:hypothetical protein